MNWAKVLKKINRLNNGVNTFSGDSKPILNWAKVLRKINRLSLGVNSFTGSL
jgi:hypothetical protein